MKILEEEISLFSGKNHSDFIKEIKLYSSEVLPSFNDIFNDPIAYYQNIHIRIAGNKMKVTRLFQFNTLPGLGMNVIIEGQIIEQANGVCIACRVRPHTFWQVIIIGTISIAVIMQLMSLFLAVPVITAIEFLSLISFAALMYLSVIYSRRSLVKLFIKTLDLRIEGCT